MIDQYIDKVKDFIIKHCERKAKQCQVPINEIQVRFSLNANAEQMHYSTCKNYAKFEETSFNQICNFTFGVDLLGYGNQVEPLIHGALIYLCNDNQIEAQRLFVFVAPDENFVTVDEDSAREKKERLKIHVYNFDKWVKSMSVAEFVLANIMGGQEQAGEG